MPAVALLVVNHHTAAECLALLARLDADGVASSFETHLLENGSGPDDRAALAAASARLAVSDRNLGFGAGVNLLAARASAAWLLLMNPDVAPDPGLFARVLERLPLDPRVGVVGGLRRGDGPRSHGAFPGLLDRFRRSAGDAPGEVDWVSGCFMLIRRALFEQLGGFDGGYFMQLEDADLCWRARAAGFRVVVDTDFGFAHAGHLSYARSGRALAADWRASRTRFLERTGRPYAARLARLFDALRSVWARERDDSIAPR